ncbi:hypothetical protein JCM8097_004303 [Rhodosporidiobolus ruineniae]
MDSSTLTVRPNQGQPTLLDLPIELLLAILEGGVRRNERAQSLQDLALVCKAFASIVHLLRHQQVSLHSAEQAQGFLASLRRAPSPTRLAASTRRLSLSYSVGPLAPDQAKVPAAVALPILFWLDNLRYLDLDGGDDALKLFRQARAAGGAGSPDLVFLRVGRVRVDKLVEMVAGWRKLVRLEAKDVYQAEPTGEDAGGQDDATLCFLSLVEAHCFSRVGLVVALKLVPNLSDLELAGFTSLSATPAVPQPALPLDVVTLISSLSPDEVSHPLDHLPALTPFLHVLSLSSDDLFSPTDVAATAFSRVMALLPLQCVTLDMARPRLEVADVIEGVKRAEGRLDAIAIGKRMRWKAEMLAEAKKACAERGVLLSGEANEDPWFLR